MRYCADSSFIVRLYDPQGDATELAAMSRYLADDQKLLALSALGRLEVLNMLLRKPETGAARKFEEDLLEAVRLRVEPVDWSEAFRQAESLARRFSRTLKPGGHDLVMVAAAAVMGAAWFLSFDRRSRQRPLAAAAGLSVWPALDKDEKGQVRHARLQAGG